MEEGSQSDREPSTVQSVQKKSSLRKWHYDKLVISQGRMGDRVYRGVEEDLEKTA